MLLFVFAPIVASFVFSFNSDRFPTIPLGSFTYHWYETAFSAIRTFGKRSAIQLIVSVCAATLSTPIGFATAYTDFRYGFRFKAGYLALALLPPTVPLIILALAMLAWLSQLGIERHAVRRRSSHIRCSGRPLPWR